MLWTAWVGELVGWSKGTTKQQCAVKPASVSKSRVLCCQNLLCLRFLGQERGVVGQENVLCCCMGVVPVLQVHARKEVGLMLSEWEGD